jgi:hypothetical protein
MKKFLKSWITWVIAAVVCFTAAYFISINKQVPVETVETIKVDSTAILPDTVKNIKDTVVLDTLK